MTKPVALHARTAERGQARVELVVILPLVVLLIAGLLLHGQLLYVHLAILTAANDCATSAAQATGFDAIMRQGFAARENGLAAFQVSQRVTTGGIYSAMSSHNAFGNIACQVGYPLETRWLGTFDGTIFVSQRSSSVQYTIHLPWQPYKSN